jgi:RNA polymerase sigma-70 factor (ECF subfamily)
MPEEAFSEQTKDLNFRRRLAALHLPLPFAFADFCAAVVQTAKAVIYSRADGKSFYRCWNKIPRSAVYAMQVANEPLPGTKFEELALPLFDQLYNFARWLTQDTTEADDLVQETFTKALRGFSSFQPGTNFRAWMYRILRNSFLSSRTGLKNMVAFDEEAHEPAKETSTPESLLIEHADREMVQKALADLPVHFREILLLCEVEEM